MSLIEPGKKAPAFSLKESNRQDPWLSDYVAASRVVFLSEGRYAGCTKEACAFQDNLPRFSRARPRCWESHSRRSQQGAVCGKIRTSRSVACRRGSRVAEKYGLAEEVALRTLVQGIVRTTYDRSRRKSCQRWDNVNVDGHAQTVLRQRKQSNWQSLSDLSAGSFRRGFEVNMKPLTFPTSPGRVSKAPSMRP